MSNLWLGKLNRALRMPAVGLFSCADLTAPTLPCKALAMKLDAWTDEIKRAETLERLGSHEQWRKRVMARARQGAKAPEKELVRANLRLDAEQYRRLLVFSVMESRSAGDIVSKLLEDHLKGWSMPGKVAAPGSRSTRVTSNDRLDMTDQASESVADAA